MVGLIMTGAICSDMDDALAKINQHEAECAQFRKHVTYRLDTLDKSLVELKAEFRRVVYFMAGAAGSVIGYLEFLR